MAIMSRIRSTSLALGLGVLALGGWRVFAQREAAAAIVPAAARPTGASTEELLAAWKRVLAQDSSSAIALGTLAALHLQRARDEGDFADYAVAESLARRSLHFREQRNGSTYATLAAALLAQHEFVEARVTAERMRALAPDEPAYASILGEIDAELGRYDEARSLLEPLYPQRGSLAIGARLARWAELTGRTSQARRLLVNARNEALERRDLPAEQVAWFDYRVADFELRHGHTRAADAYLTHGLALRPQDPRLLNARARWHAARGDVRAAIASAERAVAGAPDPAAFALASELYAQAGDSAKAGDYARALEVSVAGQPGAYHRAWSLFLLDHANRHDEVLANALEEYESRKDIYGADVVAWGLHRLRRDAEAIPYVERALSLGTEDAMLLYHASEILRASGRTERADELRTRARAVNPGLSYFQPRGPR